MEYRLISSGEIFSAYVETPNFNPQGFCQTPRLFGEPNKKLLNEASYCPIDFMIARICASEGFLPI